jgi:hypothetical protein
LGPGLREGLGLRVARRLGGERSAAPRRPSGRRPPLPFGPRPPLSPFTLLHPPQPPQEATDIDGTRRHLSEFAGRVTLVVNVASYCGFTDSNYRGLQSVYEKYHEHGLEVM